MAEIEQAVGVPASTLYQWAARGGWRWRDLDVTEPAGAHRDCPTPQASQERPPARTPDLIRGRTEPTQGEEDHGQTASAAQLREAGAASMGRALVLAQAGKARAAREALLLGQRFVRAAQLLDQAGGETPEETDEEAAQRRQAEARTELEARVGRLFDFHMKRSVRAAEQIGLTEIGMPWAGPLDLSAFAIDAQTWRRATPEELARVKAGDWPIHETVPPGPYSQAARVVLAKIMVLPEETCQAIMQEAMDVVKAAADAQARERAAAGVSRGRGAPGRA